jgi:glycosyltransferase involved in cell wall biosynthesis
MVYHNITPSEYFSEYNNSTYRLVLDGLDQVKYLHDKFDYCLAVSEFNRLDLISYGYKCPIDVIPVIIPFSIYDRNPSKELLHEYNDDYKNLLFLGRISPNKKQEDIIAAFFCYQKYYNKKSRLFLVGNWEGMEQYYSRLRDYINVLGVENVVFSGHASFDEVLSYYSLADVFLCMSEHEGFCVPLVEAMYFDVPVIARASAAIPSTLGGAGIMIKEKEPHFIAGLINAINTDQALRTHILNVQQERVKAFAYETVRGQIVEFLAHFIRR